MQPVKHFTKVSTNVHTCKETSTKDLYKPAERTNTLIVSLLSQDKAMTVFRKCAYWRYFVPLQESDPIYCKQTELMRDRSLRHRPLPPPTTAAPPTEKDRSVAKSLSNFLRYTKTVSYQCLRFCALTKLAYMEYIYLITKTRILLSPNCTRLTLYGRTKIAFGDTRLARGCKTRRWEAKLEYYLTILYQN